jgi:hypothetical protein
METLLIRTARKTTTKITQALAAVDYYSRWFGNEEEAAEDILAMQPFQG